MGACRYHLLTTSPNERRCKSRSPRVLQRPRWRLQTLSPPTTSTSHVLVLLRWTPTGRRPSLLFVSEMQPCSTMS